MLEVAVCHKDVHKEITWVILRAYHPLTDLYVGERSPRESDQVMRSWSLYQITPGAWVSGRERCIKKTLGRVVENVPL